MELQSAQVPNSLLEQALAYAGGGMPVFPVHSPKSIGLCDCSMGVNCESPAKHPWTPDGFKSAAIDEITIRNWWKRYPRANVAIAVPSGYVVLDIDGEEGQRALKEVTPVTHLQTPVAKTGKGWHYWFRTDTDLPPRANMLPKVDLRGPGSYVVAPPSIHIQGKPYIWRKPFTEVEMMLAPDWLLDLAKRPTVAGVPTGVHFDTATALAGVAEGQRDATIFRFASKMRYADVPYDTAVRLALEAAANCTPPFSPEIAVAKVDAVYGKYQPSIRLDTGEGTATLISEDTVRVELVTTNGPVEFVFQNMEKTASSLDAELSIQLLMPGTTADQYVQRINLLSHTARDLCRRELETIFAFDKGVWAKLLNRSFVQAQSMFLGVDRSKRACDIPSPTKMEYIVDGLVLEGRPTILFGAGSAGKTFLLLSMMMAIARGEAWQGRKTQKRNCLLVDYESGGPTVGFRLRRLADGEGLQEVPDNIFHWWADGIPLLDQIDALKACIRKNNIGVVGIDHCGAACGTEPEKAEAALRFYRACSKLQVPVVALAHVTGDGETNPDAVRRPFGSIYWSNGAGLTWYVRREDQDEEADYAQLGMFARKYNDSARPSAFALEMAFGDDSGPVRLSQRAIRDSAQLTATRGTEYLVLGALVRPMSYLEIAEACGLSSDAVRKTIQRHPTMFERAPDAADTKGGRGQVATWQRKALIP